MARLYRYTPASPLWAIHANFRRGAKPRATKQLEFPSKGRQFVLIKLPILFLSTCSRVLTTSIGWVTFCENCSCPQTHGLKHVGFPLFPPLAEATSGRNLLAVGKYMVRESWCGMCRLRKRSCEVAGSISHVGVSNAMYFTNEFGSLWSNVCLRRSGQDTPHTYPTDVVWWRILPPPIGVWCSLRNSSSNVMQCISNSCIYKVCSKQFV